MALQKRKTRMYEPWGYQDENNYKSTEILVENDFDAFLVDTSYNKDDNKIYFTNKDGEVKASLDVNEFVKSDSIIEKTEYKDGILKIYFTNGDVITVNLTELIDENEFKDGLIVDDHVVKVLIDSTGEPYLSVSEDGVKISGIDAAIQVETDRATAAEQALDEKIENEITRATEADETLDAKIDNEIQRATEEEQRIETKLDDEITRATRTEQHLDSRIDAVNDELDAEESTREANDAALNLKINTEIADRKAADNEEKERAMAAEQALDDKIDAESQRAQNEEEALSERIDEIASGSSSEKLDELIEKLGYDDNDTLETNNEHDVAFGEYNLNNETTDPSGKTVFSIGIGTSDDNRKNAIEVRKDGEVYIWIEGEYMSINKLLGQIAHELYD